MNRNTMLFCVGKVPSHTSQTQQSGSYTNGLRTVSMYCHHNFEQTFQNDSKLMQVARSTMPECILKVLADKNIFVKGPLPPGANPIPPNTDVGIAMIHQKPVGRAESTTLSTLRCMVRCLA